MCARARVCSPVVPHLCFIHFPFVHSVFFLLDPSAFVLCLFHIRFPLVLHLFFDLFFICFQFVLRLFSTLLMFVFHLSSFILRSFFISPSFVSSFAFFFFHLFTIYFPFILHLGPVLFLRSRRISPFFHEAKYGSCAVKAQYRFVAWSIFRSNFREANEWMSRRNAKFSGKDSARQTWFRDKGAAVIQIEMHIRPRSGIQGTWRRIQGAQCRHISLWINSELIF